MLGVSVEEDVCVGDVGGTGSGAGASGAGCGIGSIDCEMGSTGGGDAAGVSAATSATGSTGATSVAVVASKLPPPSALSVMQKEYYKKEACSRESAML